MVIVTHLFYFSIVMKKLPRQTVTEFSGMPERIDDLRIQHLLDEITSRSTSPSHLHQQAPPQVYPQRASIPPKEHVLHASRRISEAFYANKFGSQNCDSIHAMNPKPNIPESNLPGQDTIPPMLLDRLAVNCVIGGNDTNA